MTDHSISPNAVRYSRLRALLESARPHQWSKNLLVFVPALLSDHFGDKSALYATCIAFAGVSAVASATYILNDLVDAPTARVGKCDGHVSAKHHEGLSSAVEPKCQPERQQGKRWDHRLRRREVATCERAMAL